MLISVWVFSPWPIEKLSVVADVLQSRGPYACRSTPRSAGKIGSCSFSQVDAAPLAEAHEHAVLEDRVEAEPQAELVEVHVAALGDRADQVERAVALLLPAAEVPVADRQPAAARLRHVGVEGRRCPRFSAMAAVASLNGEAGG